MQDKNTDLVLKTLWVTSKLWQRLFLYAVILGISYIVMSFFALMGNWMASIDTFCGTTRLTTNFLKEVVLYSIVFSPGIIYSLILELDIKYKQKKLGKEKLQEIKKNTLRIIENEADDEFLLKPTH